MVNITWEEAEQFCFWAGLSLPSEEEWEKAARGDDRRKFPWGNQSPSDMLCVWQDHQVYGRKSTVPVSFCPEGKSPFGVYQMAGNVHEYCENWYDYGRNVNEAGKYKVTKGGAFDRCEDSCITFSSRPVRKSFRYKNVGFRVIKKGSTTVANEYSPFEDNESYEETSESHHDLDKIAIESFHDAIHRFDLERVKEMLLQESRLANARNNDGEYPLHSANKFSFLESQFEIAKLLIEAGAWVNAKDKNGAMPLHYAAVNAQWFGLQMLVLLLENGADGYALDKSGMRPVDTAKEFSFIYGDVALHIFEKFGFKLE